MSLNLPLLQYVELFASLLDPGQPQLPRRRCGVGTDEQTAVAGWLVLYPEYLDAARSRAAGRRVARECSVAAPTDAQIEAALRAIGLRFLAEPKLHPHGAREPRFRFRVEAQGLKKADLLREVALQIKVARENI